MTTMGKDDIKPPVTIHVNGGNATRKAISQGFCSKFQRALIPKDLTFTVDTGEDQIEIAVLVQIVDSHPRAIAFIGFDLAQAGASGKG